MLSKQKSDGRLSAVSTSGGSFSWLRSTSCRSTDGLHKSQSGWFSTAHAPAHVTSGKLRFVKCLREAPFWNMFGAFFSHVCWGVSGFGKMVWSTFSTFPCLTEGKNAQIATFFTKDRDWRTHLFWTNVSFFVIFYSNANSLQLFCENSSLNLANFTDWGGDNGAEII